MIGAGTVTFTVGDREIHYYPLPDGADKLPYSLRILLENIQRNVADQAERERLSQELIQAGIAGEPGGEIPFMPYRVLLTDFTGVPCIVDFAAMRDAVASVGGDPAAINPLCHADLVIDHSVIADVTGEGACKRNMQIEFERNQERYRFLKWGQGSFDDLRIVPPGAGICHQLNLERLSSTVVEKNVGGRTIALPDTLVGADSHTPTVNGLSVVAWGVGGIEAEAVMLGQPISILTPRVVGVRLTGQLQDGVVAMDLALSMAHELRKLGVVGSFVECFGPGVETLSVTDRATVTNMSPEYGSTIVHFPVDERTLDFYRLMGRDDDHIQLVEQYSKAQGLWHEPEIEHTYAQVIEIDLSSIERSLSGPSRPHDLIAFREAKEAFDTVSRERGLDTEKTAIWNDGEKDVELSHGAVAIAAITSCTTTANPELVIEAGLVAKRAVELGLQSKPWIKRMLSPGSPATADVLRESGLLAPLEELGFYIAGFGCMSCIGNSGPIDPNMSAISRDVELAAVLSGNRNFEGRIGPDLSQNYLMAPATVVLYSIAGTMDLDPMNDPIGEDRDGNPVFMNDLLPSRAEMAAEVERFATTELYTKAHEGLLAGDESWRSLESDTSVTYDWDTDSTYVRKPPYFMGFGPELPTAEPITGARVLLNLGDFITTDHISPAGSIAPDSPAAQYLERRGVSQAEFNTYGSRRGNHEVMMRGTFSNPRIVNLLADGQLGGYTKDFTDGTIRTIWGAASSYAQRGIPLIVLAGKMYGSGSSRDWAAKGPALIGVKAVIAESYERIHRSNLVGMGVLPFQYLEGQNAASLGIIGTETFDFPVLDLASGVVPEKVTVTYTDEKGEKSSFDVILRIDTPTEAAYVANGGVMPYMLRDILNRSKF